MNAYVRALLPAAALLAGGAYVAWKQPRHGRPVAPVQWKQEPVQAPAELEPFTLPTAEGPIQVLPRARYALDGVLVSHRRNQDAFAHLMPVDACVVWGRWGDRAARADVSFSNHGRVCYFQWTGAVDSAHLGTHLSNNHLVPANDNIRRALFWMDDGDEVRLEGHLVDLQIPVPQSRLSVVLDQLARGEFGNVERTRDTFIWRTSMTRTDQGMGACETLWVTAVQIGTHRYQ